MHAYYVGELVLHGKYLYLLIEGHWVNTWNPDTLLIVELVLEVLDVEVL